LLKKVFENTPAGSVDKRPSNSIDVLSGKNILLVEDNDFLGSIMLSRLSAKNAHTVVAKNGEDAVIELAKQKFDAALLDVLLPGMSGFDVLESIRKNEETKDLPVTVISNFNQQKDRERAATMGAGFFVKALVNPDDILQQVEKMLLGKHI
jgi:CheY-like chemotaxis protein